MEQQGIVEKKPLRIQIWLSWGFRINFLSRINLRSIYNIYKDYNYYNNGDNMSEYAMISVHKDTRELLKSYGSKGETYDTLIRKMLSIVSHAQIMETHYQRLKEKDQFIPLSEL